jgi:hypothetical protein
VCGVVVTAAADGCAVDVADAAVYIAMMLISTKRPRQGWDRHAMHLREVAMRVVSMYGPSYRDG